MLTAVELDVRLGALRDELRSEIADQGVQLRSEMAAQGAQLRSEMADLGTTLRSEMAAQGSQLRSEMADLGAQLRSEMAEQGAQLRGGIATVRGELGAFRDVVGEMFARVMAELTALETRLRNEINDNRIFIAGVLSEDVRRQFAALDDKYRDVPGQQSQLRTDFEGHAANTRIHVTSPAPPRRRRARKRPR